MQVTVYTYMPFQPATELCIYSYNGSFKLNKTCSVSIRMSFCSLGVSYNVVNVCDFVGQLMKYSLTGEHLSKTEIPFLSVRT